MLATIVTPSVNTAQLFALIAVILFIVAFLGHVFTREGGPNTSYHYVGNWLMVAGFIFVALCLLWGF